LLAAGALLKVSHLTRDPQQRLHMVTEPEQSTSFGS
jgi:hypothetical protein